MNLLDIVNAARKAWPFDDGFCPEHGFFLHDADCSNFIARYNPEHAMLIEDLVDAARSHVVACSKRWNGTEDCSDCDCWLRMSVAEITAYRKAHGYEG